MKSKGLMALFIFVFLMLSVFASAGFVAAQGVLTGVGQDVVAQARSQGNVNVPSPAGTFDIVGKTSDFLGKIFFIDSTDIIQNFSILFFTILIIILIYSALAYVQFPESAAIRWVLALIVGFLSTAMISSDEVIAALNAYTALGITFILFFPLLVLTFFSFVISVKGNPFGIMSQKIMWVIYSVYLFIKTGLLAILAVAARYGAIDATAQPQGFSKFLALLVGQENFVDVASGSGDFTILIVLGIVSVFVFFIFVLHNRAFTQWVRREKLHADIDNYSDTAQRSKSARKTDADLTR